MCGCRHANKLQEVSSPAPEPQTPCLPESTPTLPILPPNSPSFPKPPDFPFLTRMLKPHLTLATISVFYPGLPTCTPSPRHPLLQILYSLGLSNAPQPHVTPITCPQPPFCLPFSSSSSTPASSTFPQTICPSETLLCTPTTEVRPQFLLSLILPSPFDHLTL